MACARAGKKIKPNKPRWQLAGYKKKANCDKCNFRARYSSQLLVIHIDGDCNHVNFLNLKTLCLNCWAAAKKEDQPWRAGDLEADL
jgi:hypothetical protein